MDLSWEMSSSSTLQNLSPKQLSMSFKEVTNLNRHKPSECYIPENKDVVFWFYPKLSRENVTDKSAFISENKESLAYLCLDPKIQLIGVASKLPETKDLASKILQNPDDYYVKPSKPVFSVSSIIENFENRLSIKSGKSTKRMFKKPMLVNKE
jgi:hypothetical protein